MKGRDNLEVSITKVEKTRMTKDEDGRREN